MAFRRWASMSYDGCEFGKTAIIAQRRPCFPHFSRAFDDFGGSVPPVGNAGGAWRAGAHRRSEDAAGGVCMPRSPAVRRAESGGEQGVDGSEDRADRAGRVDQRAARRRPNASRA